MDWVKMCKQLSSSLVQLTEDLKIERSKKRIRVDNSSDYLYHLLMFIKSIEVDKNNEEVFKCHAKILDVFQVWLSSSVEQSNFDEHLSRVELLFGQAIDEVPIDALHNVSNKLHLETKKHKITQDDVNSDDEK